MSAADTVNLRHSVQFFNASNNNNDNGKYNGNGNGNGHRADRRKSMAQQRRDLLLSNRITKFSKSLGYLNLYLHLLCAYIFVVAINNIQVKQEFMFI